MFFSFFLSFFPREKNTSRFIVIHKYAEQTVDAYPERSVCIHELCSRLVGVQHLAPHTIERCTSGSKTWLFTPSKPARLAGRRLYEVSSCGACGVKVCTTAG